MAFRDYEPYIPDAIKDDAARAAALSGGNFLEVEQGANYLRILPAFRGKRPFRITQMHHVDVPGGKTFVFSCPRAELKIECPACIEADRLKRLPNAAAQEEGKRMSAKMSVYCNAIHRQHPERGVQIYRFGSQVWKQIERLLMDTRSGGDLTDPTERGYDINVYREGTGVDSTYDVKPDRNLSTLAPSEDEANALLDARKDLEDQVIAAVPEALQLQWQSMALRQGLPSGFQRGGVQALGAGLRPQIVPQTAQAPLQGVGAGIMGQRPLVQQAVEYDDDMNPIVR